jgi:hypothetical protein
VQASFLACPAVASNKFTIMVHMKFTQSRYISISWLLAPKNSQSCPPVGGHFRMLHLRVV